MTVKAKQIKSYAIVESNGVDYVVTADGLVLYGIGGEEVPEHDMTDEEYYDIQQAGIVYLSKFYKLS